MKDLRDLRGGPFGLTAWLVCNLVEFALLAERCNVCETWAERGRGGVIRHVHVLSRGQTKGYGSDVNHAGLRGARGGPAARFRV